MGEDGGTRERRYFLESRKYQRTCVVNGKAAGFKLGVALATCRPAPVAGESLNRPDASKLSSVRFLLSPFVSPVLSFTLCQICPYTARRLYVAAGKTGHYNIRVG